MNETAEILQNLEHCPWCGHSPERDDRLAWCATPGCVIKSHKIPLRRWSVRARGFFFMCKMCKKAGVIPPGLYSNSLREVFEADPGREFFARFDDCAQHLQCDIDTSDYPGYDDGYADEDHAGGSSSGAEPH